MHFILLCFACARRMHNNRPKTGRYLGLAQHPYEWTEPQALAVADASGASCSPLLSSRMIVSVSLLGPGTNCNREVQDSNT
jgi:hypothetical protein